MKLSETALRFSPPDAVITVEGESFFISFTRFAACISPDKSPADIKILSFATIFHPSPAENHICAAFSRLNTPVLNPAELFRDGPPQIYE